MPQHFPGEDDGLETERYLDISEEQERPDYAPPRPLIRSGSVKHRYAPKAEVVAFVRDMAAEPEQLTLVNMLRRAGAL